MEQVNVNIKKDESSYKIYITKSFDNFFQELIKIKNITNVIIIADYNAYKFHGESFEKQLKRENINVHRYFVNSSEVNKSFSTVKKIYRYLNKVKADRSYTIISFGGGIIGDIAGFVAATYLRGLDYVQVPTTLLSQVDSSIGGKVGVNYENKKNLIGAFYQPIFVYINVKVLKTLEDRQFNSGMVEIIKHALISDKNLLKSIEIYEKDNFDELIKIIKKSCEIKAKVVMEDEKEISRRMILNLGHTIGHAIESSTKFKIFHGEAVAIGILASMVLSKNLGKITQEDFLRIRNLFVKLNMPLKYIKKMKYQNLLIYIKNDKKIKNNILNYIILNSIGNAEILPIQDYQVIKRIIENLKQE